MYTPARLGVGEGRGSWGRQQQPRETKESREADRRVESRNEKSRSHERDRAMSLGVVECECVVGGLRSVGARRLAAQGVGSLERRRWSPQ